MWKDVKNGPSFPTHGVNNVAVNKKEDGWTKEVRENMQCSLKAKTIITTNLGLDIFLRVSHIETSKEM